MKVVGMFLNPLEQSFGKSFRDCPTSSCEAVCDGNPLLNPQRRYLDLDTYLMQFLFYMTFYVKFSHMPFFLFALFLTIIKMFKSFIL